MVVILVNLLFLFFWGMLSHLFLCVVNPWPLLFWLVLNMIAWILNTLFLIYVTMYWINIFRLFDSFTFAGKSLLFTRLLFFILINFEKKIISSTKLLQLIIWQIFLQFFIYSIQNYSFIWINSCALNYSSTAFIWRYCFGMYLTFIID